MKNIIEKIYKRTTEYSDPKQATTTASALDLLSLGIYTEEERFIFELLQNAVDSFNGLMKRELAIKIITTDKWLIFMHNGRPFTERDLEGLCDIGNGSKVNDLNKIGYKGIGFKSVFMHSHKVVVETAGTCFKFDKEACDEICQSKGVEYENAKLPWQIIPIPSETPVIVNTTGYTVVTYIETQKIVSLGKKVEKLLSDPRFLLFLNVSNLHIRFYNGKKKILSLSKSEKGGIVSLYRNKDLQSQWLTYSVRVDLTTDVLQDIALDVKTPSKIKESTFVEISFAISLNTDKNIERMEKACVYTYLPTSFDFGLPFIVNSNFITDAGRQQIVKDCEWNKYIFSQIPQAFFQWIRDVVSIEYEDWFKILPLKSNDESELGDAYNRAFENALSTIPFIKTIKGDSVLVKDALCDVLGLSRVLPVSVYDNFVRNEISQRVSSDTLISVEVGSQLDSYGISFVRMKELIVLLENSCSYLRMLSDGQLITMLKWLKELSNDDYEFHRSLPYFEIVFDENNDLAAPKDLFFPSEYREENELALSAKVISSSFAKLFDDGMIKWLTSIGVEEMSPVSVIEKILCNPNFITSDNAISVVQFIFDASQKIQLFNEISKWQLQNLKFLTKKGTLKEIHELYLSSEYNPSLNIEPLLNRDIYISSDYIRSYDNIHEWSYFFQKLGINVSFDINKKIISVSDARRIPFLYNAEVASNKVGYLSQNGITYYFKASDFEVYYYPFISYCSKSEFGFSKYFWTEVFSKSKPSYRGETIYGYSGYTNFYRELSLQDCVNQQYYVDWEINHRQLFPTSTNEFMHLKDILPNKPEYVSLCDKYFPVLNIDTQIHSSWERVLNFKEKLVLEDYLKILEKISQDDAGDSIKANKQRINLVYDHISSEFDFSKGSSAYETIKEWGNSHLILSKNLKFDSPQNLNLLSSVIGDVDLENQVFHDKYLENNRFADMMVAMGVRFVKDYTVDYGEGNMIQDIHIVNSLKTKLEPLTVIASISESSDLVWEDSKKQMLDRINQINFYKVPYIKITYGEQTIEKSTYSNNRKFYYVGRWGFAQQELMHSELAKVLGIKDKTTFLTILQMSDPVEIKHYLMEKGYDVSDVQNKSDSYLPDMSDLELTMRGEDGAFGGLTQQEMYESLQEAKNLVLKRLDEDGYDISQAEWDGWTCVNGVTKDGIEYPLVVRSNRSGSNTRISPTDWNQLMKPNAMFAVNSIFGIGTVVFKDVLKSKENISIRFSSNNIEFPQHISELTRVLAYFKGIQFDFESYVQPLVHRWERFLSPEQNTDEQPIAVDNNLLPE